MPLHAATYRYLPLPTATYRFLTLPNATSATYRYLPSQTVVYDFIPPPTLIAPSLLQTEGTIVLVLSSAFHFGFNHGECRLLHGGCMVATRC